MSTTVYGVATGEYDEWQVRALFVDRIDAARAVARLIEPDEDGNREDAGIVELPLLPPGNDDLRVYRWVSAYAQVENGDRWHFDEREVAVAGPPEVVTELRNFGGVVLHAIAATFGRAAELLDAGVTARRPS